MNFRVLEALDDTFSMSVFQFKSLLIVTPKYLAVSIHYCEVCMER